MQKLDLSHNILTRFENIEFCYNLVLLDMSFNRLTSMHRCNEYLGNVKVLLLKNNALESTEGLEKLFGLESLDLSESIFDSFHVRIVFFQTKS